MKAVIQITRPYLLGLCICCSSLGCEVLHEAGVPGMRAYGDAGKRERTSESYRQRYQVDRDAESFRWLLTHEVATGMSVSDVNHALGEEGIREYDDFRFKTNSSFLRSGDKIYRWGPNNKGRSIYLGFRDGNLVNFNPEEYRT